MRSASLLVNLIRLKQIWITMLGISAMKISLNFLSPEVMLSVSIN